MLFPARVAAGCCRSGVGDFVLAYGTKNARVDLVHFVVRLPEIAISRAYSAIDEALFFDVPLDDLMDIRIELFEQEHELVDLLFVRPSDSV